MPQMNKSLIPLLIVLALVVLMTVVIINTRTIKLTERGKASSLSIDESDIKLSPYNNIEKAALHTRPAKRQQYQEKAESQKMLKQAYAEMDAGNMAAVENKARNVLVFEPDNYNAMSLLGRALYSEQKYELAEAIYRRLAELNKNDPSVYNNLGQALAKQNKFDEAIKQMSVAAKLDPESPFISLNLSGMYSVKGEKGKSIKFFRKASEVLGDQIIPISYDPTLNNIRDEPEFKQIIKEAGTLKITPGEKTVLPGKTAQATQLQLNSNLSQ
jgi:Flp pilus assembly protein TadD